jgi:mRNA-degrading endonuclease toxin of MazEF toxin-antitoxin module
MQNLKHNIKKGDVWLFENINAIGSMQKGVRPHAVVTQVTEKTVSVAPCSSSKKRKGQKFSIEIEPTKNNGLDSVSYVVLTQSFTADPSLFEGKKKIGHLDEFDILRIQAEFVKYVTE